MQKTDYLYVGMDIHKETHTAVLMTYMEEHIGEIQIENNLKGQARNPVMETEVRAEDKKERMIS